MAWLYHQPEDNKPSPKQAPQRARQDAAPQTGPGASDCQPARLEVLCWLLGSGACCSSRVPVSRAPTLAAHLCCWRCADGAGSSAPVTAWWLRSSLVCWDYKQEESGAKPPSCSWPSALYRSMGISKKREHSPRVPPSSPIARPHTTLPSADFPGAGRD